MKHRSLLSTLAFRLACAVVVGVLLGIVHLVLQFRAGVTGIDDQSIAIQVKALRRMVVLTPQGARLILKSPLRDLYADPHSYNGYQLLDADGTVLESGGFMAPFIPVPDEAGQREVIMQRELDMATNHDVIAATVVIVAGGQRYWVRVVRSLADLESVSGLLVLRALPEFSLMLLAVILGMVVVVVLTVHGALRPVREASRLAAALSVKRLGERLPETDLPREVQPLVQAINTSLERLEKDYRAQREFTAHAAHELRTPLAVLRARLEAKLSAEDLGDVMVEIEGMARLVEQLLCLAQLDAEVRYDAMPLDAYQCAVEVAREAAPLALARDHRLAAESAGAEVRIIANATLLRLVFRNLIENAIRHTPPGTAITVSARDAHTVVIEDDGPGIAPADRKQIFERFRRGAAAPSGSAGLGLAIARQVMERMGGQLLLEPARHRGAAFLVKFPAPTKEFG